ncbi:hypothetical protein KLF26_16500 (plasmid) [Clostridium perfringens]|uniref:hypothetical protein n=1 Tax=Clostridium perfringens TaxID=1502 RepID=UPI0013E32B4D|nr:hypothetical protein [Clostridium perfringens]MBI6048842.1 hypothetical protein [Clostridium perfringens]MDJ8927746.1 hypothetical protein [Clostridium perfringens]MDJ8936428.1 hypothetical protein [Clostridium perfringens]NGT40174.1 hypothetical protein [Clostridium perfringens]UBL00803.1 hypothetical protein KLF26_16500 [Clostridium perfringens]
MKIDINKIYGLYETPEHGTDCKREKIINELKEKIQDKDDELNYLCEVIDTLEEEKEELNSECEELEEELEEVKKVSESRYDLLLKAVEEIGEKDKLIKELRKENMELKMEKAAKKIQESDITFSEDLAKYIAKSGLISLKSCLNAMDLLSDKGEK